MTKISADIETDYRDASAPGRRAIVEKLQRYIDRGVWAQSVLQALAAHGTLPAQDAPSDAGQTHSAPRRISDAADEPQP